MHSLKRLLQLFLGLAAAFSAAFPGLAVAVETSSVWNAYETGYPYAESIIYDAPNQSWSRGGTTVTTSGTPYPLVIASADAQTTAWWYMASAFSGLTYRVHIAGPVPGALVPVGFSSSLYVYANAPGDHYPNATVALVPQIDEAGTQFQPWGNLEVVCHVATYSGGCQTYVEGVPGSPAPPVQISVNPINPCLTFPGCTTARANVYGQVPAYAGTTFGVNIYGSAYSSAGGHSSARADPYFYIDPTWAAANPGYSLSVSPGVANVASVPEPASAALLSAGLLTMLGLRARRRAGAAALL